MSELLKISGLWGGYNAGVDILRGIDITINEGESVGIIGLNGSGKSTLGKAIMNMIPIRRGEIEWMGEPVTALPTHELSRKGLVIMQQGGQLFQTMSVWENLKMAAAGSSLEQIRDLMPFLQRSKRELQRQKADKLSGGQKHQLALAMTLATQPKLVILDEPSAGLSPQAVEEMFQMLLDVKTKLRISIIVIEQNISKAVEFCDRILMIAQGQIQYQVQYPTIEDIEIMMFNS